MLGVLCFLAFSFCLAPAFSFFALSVCLATLASPVQSCLILVCPLSCCVPCISPILLPFVVSAISMCPYPITSPWLLIVFLGIPINVYLFLNLCQRLISPLLRVASEFLHTLSAWPISHHPYPELFNLIPQCRLTSLIAVIRQNINKVLCRYEW